MSASIRFFVLGSVPKSFVDRVLGFLRDFLDKTSGEVYLEIYFYGTSREKLLHLESEAVELGVLAVGDFITMHEAWRGWPRIHVDYEKCRDLEDRYLRALVIHEACHAILHGSLEYYMISLDLRELSDLGFDEALKLSYLASTIIKDLDVIEYLLARDMREIVDHYTDFLFERNTDLDCESREDVFQLAKILIPCVYRENCPIERLSPGCQKHSKRVIEILRSFRAKRSRDLSIDTLDLVKILVRTL
ncbi:MAG: hypothetical protein ABWJ42_04995 [Sulfolobales archaeon]